MQTISLAQFMRETPLLVRTWWIGAISTIALTIAMAPTLQGFNILALQFSFGQAQFQNILSTMTAEQLVGFGMHYRYDFLFPVAYGLWMSVTLAWLMRKSDAPEILNAIIYLPLLAGIFDLTENSFIAPYALDFFQATDTAVFWQSICASMKYGLLAVGTVTMLALTPKAFRKA